VSGTLYVVATPIGNLEDVTRRAVRVLGEVDAIACEDTRVTRRLLDHLGIHKPMLSYYYPRERAKKEAILARLREGQSVALLTDSGTPGISDPGSLLVREALDEGIRVEPIPGPCAAAAAYSASGFDDRSFYFAGFLPDATSERRRELHRLARIPAPVIFYIAPHDVRIRLEEIRTFFGDRTVLLAREVTKAYEEVRRTTLASLIESLPERPRGEFVVIVAPGEAPPAEVEKPLKERYRELLEQGLSPAQATKRLSQEKSLSKSRIAELLGENEG